MIDSYVYIIVALLPLAALILVLQVNPYHALVIRGILGAIAALVYAILGAADVALTEALVGTMLAITLYAVAVRSSLVMRLGMLENSTFEPNKVIDNLRTTFNKYHLRLELVTYPDEEALHKALLAKEIHATLTSEETQSNRIVTRIKRLYEIMQTELTLPHTNLTYVSAANTGEKK